MKAIFKISVVSLAFVLLTAFSAFSDSCDDGRKIFKHALNNAPDEMTYEYLNSALDICADKYEIYKDAAKYYKSWFENELNPEKQQEFKDLAVKYYTKALESGMTEKNELSAELNSLQGSRDFNKVAFRALKPSKPGAIHTGLDIRINFERNSSNLSGDYSILDELGDVMKENPNITISLEGHTDKTGTLEYNDELSFSRAETVKNYISEKYGVDPSRMQVSGYGYKYLVDTENPDGSLNRRVEVIKLSN